MTIDTARDRAAKEIGYHSFAAIDAHLSRLKKGYVKYMTVWEKRGNVVRRAVEIYKQGNP